MSNANPYCARAIINSSIRQIRNKKKGRTGKCLDIKEMWFQILHILGKMYLISRLYSFRFTVYYYWLMNLAAFISFSILPVIALNGAPPLIPADYGAWQQRTHRLEPRTTWLVFGCTTIWSCKNIDTCMDIQTRIGCAQVSSLLLLLRQFSWECP